MRESNHPFRLNGALGAARWLEPWLERVSGLDLLDRRYGQLPPAGDTDAFLRQVLDALQIRIDVDTDLLAQIPASGPVVVVANHPFGAIEGVILAALLRRVRSDVLILANPVLERIPELKSLFISVDPFGGRTAAQRNGRPLRRALGHLQQGGLLVVFPAGEVAHLRLPAAQVAEPAWQETAARLVQHSQATVVPVHFPGRNSGVFQLAGLIHPRLRTALLPRELINKQGHILAVRIGTPLPYARLKGYPEAGELTAFLRLRCQALGDQSPQASAVPRPREPVATTVPEALLGAEVAALPPEQQLDSSGELQVWYARAGQIPWLLQELGRLREITFRAAGEGTGRSRDIDLYDAYYLHLFVWNSTHREVVGAYRLGLADEILGRFGKKGLYTHSLFRYRRRLLDTLNPAIELGRSFVRPEYQRNYAPLLLLWKGIGQFVARHPRYRVLFGPVSISSDYASVSQQLLVEFLRANNSLPQLARHVRPRRPFRAHGRPSLLAEVALPRDLDRVSELVSAIERDQKGVPVLLRQYLKLGGHILGFNVDEQFNNALDGLIMVDLRHTDARVLAKYMGREQAAAFLAQHTAGPQRRRA